MIIDTFDLLICGLVTVAASCLLYAFVLHMKMRTLARRTRDQRAELDDRVAQVTQTAEQLKVQLAELEKPQGLPAQPINLNKRGQILRMRRRGERLETIAGALSIPRNEVELLIKVQDLGKLDKGEMPA